MTHEGETSQQLPSSSSRSYMCQRVIQASLIIFTFALIFYISFLFILLDTWGSRVAYALTSRTRPGIL